MTTKTATSIVRMGPMESIGGVSCAQLLRTALLSHLNQQEQQQQQDDEGHRLTLSNKYFTADVVLKDLEPSSSSTSSTSSGMEDGMILVFDALASNPDRPSDNSNSNSSTFDSLAHVHSQAEQSKTCGDLLRLCVGVSLTTLSPEEIRGSKNAEKEYSRRILWCLDHGYEYIEVDLSQTKVGHNERDKEGFARVVEAIQGTVWSSAIMSNSKTTELKDTYQQDTTTVLQKHKEENNPYQPPDPSNFAAGEQDGKQQQEEKNAIEDMAQQLRQQVDEEKVFDEMETVLREATRIRDQSKSGQLTDEERRDRAGDAALRLVNLMSQFGNMDDDEEEDDNSILDSDEDSGIVDAS
eukprot:scaffold1663_cov210-Cylindrotheca_fusiformis.AAC.3